jgi:hypothetical protein
LPASPVWRENGEKMNTTASDPVRSRLVEKALLDELHEVSSWLGELERRARAQERVERRLRRLRRISARLDAQIRLIRELRGEVQIGTA